MTAPEPPPSPSKAVDPLFVWNDKYLEQLRAIAETDEVPEGLDWPALREAIKVQIIKVVEEFQGAPRSPWLHPAAKEAAHQQAAAQAKKEGESSSGGGVNGNSSNGQDATASSSTSTADAAAAALEDRFASSSSSTAAAAPSTSAEQPTDADTDAPRSRRHSRQGARGLSEGSDGSAAPTSPGSDDEDFDLPDANDVNLDLSSTTATAADRSGYYPAKTAPPPTHNGSWGRLLTPAKQKEETYLCLQMLDGFESSPPFTIQRLAEVLLDPARFVRSAPKFTASLLRLLSVTAGHDDFPPVEPGVAPGAVNTVMMTNSNGGGGGVDAGQQINGVGAVVGAVELQRMTGPPSPMAEPIFSPIPFLQRPRMEGMEGGQEEGQGDQGDDVPTLELGELAHPAADSKAAGPSRSNVVEPPPAPVVLQSATAAATSTAGQSGAASSQPPPAAPLGLSGIGGSELPASSSSTSSQPLGVPPGRVDELDEYSGVANGTNPSTNISNGGGGAGGPGDPSGQGSSSSATSASDGGSAAEGHQYGREVHPLSSTTTTTRAAPVDAVMADAEAGKGAQAAVTQGTTTTAAATAGSEKGDEARMEEEESDDGGHRAKRLKSEEPH